MNIKKKNELKSKNDLYVLEVIDNYIITNDEYKGIKVLDYDLNLVKNIPLFDGIAVHHIYKHFSKNELILDLMRNKIA